jgi:hypothetical protein
LKLKNILLPLILILLLLSIPSLGKANTGLADKFLKVNGWQGVCTITVNGRAECPNEETNCNYQSVFKESLTYSGIFTPMDPQKTSWKMTQGSVIVKIDNETYEVASESKTRSTDQANQTLNVASLNQTIVFKMGDTGYSLEFPDTRITVRSTLYEPNEPKQIGQVGDNYSTIRGGKPAGLSYPTAGLQLQGSRKINVLVDPPGGDTVTMEAEFSWQLEPAVKLAPLN